MSLRNAEVPSYDVDIALPLGLVWYGVMAASVFCASYMQDSRAADDDGLSFFLCHISSGYTEYIEHKWVDKTP